MQAFIARTRQQITSHPLAVLTILFLIVQLILYARIGVFTNLEAEKYINEGNLLFTSGHLSEPKYIFYLPVILLVYICQLFSISIYFIVMVQVFLSWIAMCCFYRLGLRLTNIRVAFISSLLLILFFPLQAWNFYLYSDSIFISLSIIYVYTICIYKDQSFKSYFLILLFLIILTFSRPNGMLFILPTIVYFLFRKQSKTQLISALVLCAALIFSLYFLIFVAFTGGGELDILKPYVEEHIICFVPQKPEGANISIVKTSNPVNDLFYYILHNPSHFLGLMLRKLFSFFNLTRPYYSQLHNIYLAIVILPTYLFALIGAFKLRKVAGDMAIFILALLILYPLAVTFQCDDWHSRFTMSVFPYLILLGCLGGEALLNKKSKKST